MKSLYSWLRFAWVFVPYLLWRAGLLRRRPAFTDNVPLYRIAIGQMFRWKRRVRVVNGENCPSGDPALFVSNHHKLDDPIDLWPAIHWGSGETISTGFVMRDDFFNGFPWNWSPVNVNHLCEMAGAVLISRDQIRLTQLRQLLEVLGRPGSLLLFPGRTRSRTGAWFEYRDEYAEPGSAAFIVNHAQRRNAGVRIAVVPVARTWHPVRNSSAVVFGKALYLEADADRNAQRVLDCALLCGIGGLVEVHAVHLAALLLYLHLLHGGQGRLPKQFFTAAAEKWHRDAPHPYTDPELLADPAGEMEAALRFLGEEGVARVEDGNVTADPDAILSAPDWENDYRKRNPVKYWTNQTLHLPAVIQWAEHAVLEAVGESPLR